MEDLVSGTATWEYKDDVISRRAMEKFVRLGV